MKICIYRGTNEIGGNCIELAKGETRILLDIGTPLSSMEAPKKPLEYYKVPCPGVYADEEPDIDAIFITHNHQDHFGLLPLINPKIPVYMSATLHEILLKIQPLLSGDFDISHLNIHEIAPGETVKIGDFTIKAHPVDHAPASSAYEVSDNQKRIVYTGDIRFHSFKSDDSWALAKNTKNPDYLIMEGTRLSRKTEQDKFSTEQKVCEGIEKVLAESDKLVFISLSSQNLDSLISTIRACENTNRVFVIDAYTAALLDIFHKLDENVPTVEMTDNIKIYFGGDGGIQNKMSANKMLFKHKKQQISLEKILEAPEHYVVKHRYVMGKKRYTEAKDSVQVLQERGLQDFDFIYSLWNGYLERNEL